MVGTVDGPACTTSGDTIDVTFQNADAMEDNGDLILFVYVTGGAEFASMQAAKSPIVDADTDLGAVGIDEHMLEIAKKTTVAGVVTPGAESITVDRSMAKSGEVYLFAYRDSNAGMEGGTFSPGVPVSFLTDTSANKVDFRRRALLDAADTAITDVNRALTTGGSLGVPTDSSVADSLLNLSTLVTATEDFEPATVL